jgi:hypothetical protein
MAMPGPLGDIIRFSLSAGWNALVWICTVHKLPSISGETCLENFCGNIGIHIPEGRPLLAPAKPLVVYHYEDGRYRPAYTLDRRFLVGSD